MLPLDLYTEGEGECKGEGEGNTQTIEMREACLKWFLERNTRIRLFCLLDARGTLTKREACLKWVTSKSAYEPWALRFVFFCFLQAAPNEAYSLRHWLCADVYPVPQPRLRIPGTLPQPRLVYPVPTRISAPETDAGQALTPY